MRSSSAKLIQEAFHLIHSYPENRLLFITLTFRNRKQANEASQAFDNLNRGLLGAHLECWIRVVDVHADGKNHIHALAVARHDVRRGTRMKQVRELLNTVQQADVTSAPITWSERN